MTTVVAVRIVGGPAAGPSPGTAFTLEFGPSGGPGRRSDRDGPADVRITVPAPVLAEVVAGGTTGTAAAMSGAVRIEGDLAALGRLTGSAVRTIVPHVPVAVPLTSGGPDLLVVAGAPNDADGRLGPVAHDRWVAAVGACRAAPGSRLVASGGFGAQFNTTTWPHWVHAERWLAENVGDAVPGVVARIEPRHTAEEVLLVRELAGRLLPASVTVVTSDFHAARARFLLELAVPGADVLEVGHPDLDADERDRARRHERRALAGTVAAALLFGVDRLAPDASHAPDLARHDGRRRDAAPRSP